MAPSKKSLTFSEVLTLTLTLGFIASSLALSKLSQIKASKIVNHLENQKQITLHLSGEVKKPGDYQFYPGISVQGVLNHVGLTRQADKKQIHLKKVIFTSQEIYIPKKKSPKREVGKFH